MFFIRFLLTWYTRRVLDDTVLKNSDLTGCFSSELSPVVRISRLRVLNVSPYRYTSHVTRSAEEQSFDRWLRYLKNLASFAYLAVPNRNVGAMNIIVSTAQNFPIKNGDIFQKFSVADVL